MNAVIGSVLALAAAADAQVLTTTAVNQWNGFLGNSCGTTTNTVNTVGSNCGKNNRDSQLRVPAYNGQQLTDFDFQGSRGQNPYNYVSLVDPNPNRVVDRVTLPQGITTFNGRQYQIGDVIDDMFLVVADSSQPGGVGFEVIGNAQRRRLLGITTTSLSSAEVSALNWWSTDSANSAQVNSILDSWVDQQIATRGGSRNAQGHYVPPQNLAADTFIPTNYQTWSADRTWTAAREGCNTDFGTCCSCDSACVSFGDCCSDYSYSCRGFNYVEPQVVLQPPQGITYSGPTYSIQIEEPTTAPEEFLLNIQPALVVTPPTTLVVNTAPQGVTLVAPVTTVTAPSTGPAVTTLLPAAGPSPAPAPAPASSPVFFGDSSISANSGFTQRSSGLGDATVRQPAERTSIQRA